MKIFDAHNDFLTELNQKSRKAYINHLSIYHKKVQILSQIWTSKMPKPKQQIIKLSNEIRNQKNLIICFEDLGFINQENVDEMCLTLSKIKPFSATLTWNRDNNLGGGALGKSGLTALGKIIVRKLETSGIIIDTAHMNEKTFYDFCKVTTKPIFNSHTNLSELFHHKRNLTPNQIEKIISSKGLICLSFVKNFITNKSTFTAREVAEQIYFAVNKYGYKNFAIGSDFFGTKKLPTNLQCYLDFKNLKKELLNLGISRKIINHVFYKNLYKFYNKNKSKTK